MNINFLREKVLSYLPQEDLEKLPESILLTHLSNKEITKNNLDKWLTFSCIKGFLDLAKLSIKKGANDWNLGLHGACLGENMECVKLMIDKGANDWNRGLFGACFVGNLECVQLMIAKGADNWNRGLFGACCEGNLDCVQLMIYKGADQCSWCRKPIEEHLKKS